MISNLTISYMSTKMKSLCQRDIYNSMFITAFCIMAKKRHQPKCPSADELRKKMCYLCIMEYY